MPDTLASVIEACRKSADSLHRRISRLTDKQIRSLKEKNALKQISDHWFQNARTELLVAVDSSVLQEIDETYAEVLKRSTRNPSKDATLNLLKQLSKQLSVLAGSRHIYGNSPISVPDFSKIAKDPKIVQLLQSRWSEIDICIRAGAPLAAIVMIGGLIEALMIARINEAQDKSKIFTAQKAPRDEKKNTKQLKHWGLQNMLEVAHEIGWLTDSYLDVAMLFRDYRNYIHPYKELLGGKSFKKSDIDLVWKVTQEIVSEVLELPRQGHGA